MKSPMTPKAINPPITPANISSNGRSAPRLIKKGRKKLSNVPQTIDHTRSAVPQTAPFLA